MNIANSINMARNWEATMQIIHKYKRRGNIKDVKIYDIFVILILM